MQFNHTKLLSTAKQKEGNVAAMRENWRTSGHGETGGFAVQLTNKGVNKRWKAATRTQVRPVSSAVILTGKSHESAQGI